MWVKLQIIVAIIIIIIIKFICIALFRIHSFTAASENEAE